MVGDRAAEQRGGTEEEQGEGEAGVSHGTEDKVEGEQKGEEK